MLLGRREKSRIEPIVQSDKYILDGQPFLVSSFHRLVVFFVVVDFHVVLVTLVDGCNFHIVHVVVVVPLLIYPLVVQSARKMAARTPVGDSN